MEKIVEAISANVILRSKANAKTEEKKNIQIMLISNKKIRHITLRFDCKHEHEFTASENIAKHGAPNLDTNFDQDIFVFSSHQPFEKEKKK